MRPTTEARTRVVLDLVLAERRAQEARYGEENEVLVDGTGPETRWLLPYTNEPAWAIQADLRGDYEDFEEEAGKPTWLHLVREEVAEAFLETDSDCLAAELIQIAALCVSWVERLPAADVEPTDQQPDYLADAKRILMHRLFGSTGLMMGQAETVAQELIDALAQEGWRLINGKDFKAMASAYVMEQLR